jgi:hypothetical protein
MLTLAALLQIAGLIFTFSLGTAGYLIGPLTVIAGAWLYRHEQRRRKDAAANPPAAAPQAPPRRPGWQRFLIGLGAVLIGFAGLFALVWRLTAGLASTADEFFLALKAQDFAKAKTYLAEDFRASTSDEQLRQFVTRSALANYASASWTSRSIQNTEGTLQGVVTTASGGSIPMSISLVREGGGWKIYALHKLDAGLQVDDQSQPSEADQRRLVQATTHDFADAIARHDFAMLYDNSASIWRRQTNPADLEKAFENLAASGADFRALNQLSPKIEAAKYDGSVLVMQGTYPTTPKTFSYTYRYVYENIDWRLVGIKVNVD